MRLANREVKKRHVVLGVVGAMLLVRGLSKADPGGFVIMVFLAFAIGGFWMWIKEAKEAKRDA